MTEIPKPSTEIGEAPANIWDGLGTEQIIAEYGNDGPLLRPIEEVDSTIDAGLSEPVKQNIVPAGDRVVVPISKENVTPQMLRQGHYVTSDGLAYPIRPIK